MPRIVTTFTPYDAEDRYPDGSVARDGGDVTDAVQSGYTFFRRDTQVRSIADQKASNHYVYIVYDPTKPGTEVATGTTYGSVGSGTGSQSGDLLHPPERRHRRGDGAEARRRPGRRPPALPGHRGLGQQAGRHLVGQPQRSLVLAGAARRQRRVRR